MSVCNPMEWLQIGDGSAEAIASRDPESEAFASILTLSELPRPPANSRLRRQREEISRPESERGENLAPLRMRGVEYWRATCSPVVWRVARGGRNPFAQPRSGGARCCRP